LLLSSVVEQAYQFIGIYPTTMWSDSTQKNKIKIKTEILPIFRNFKTTFPNLLKILDWQI
jgi:hypothetical protein